MSANLLYTDDLGIGYSERNSQKLLHRHLNLALKQGELICMMGPNGAGKSTLLKTLAGFIPVQEGDAFIGHRSIQSLKEKDLSQMVSVVLTEKVSIEDFTVRELISLGRYPYTGFFGTLTEEDQKIIDLALAETGLDQFASRKLSQLSDGERQKAMIARALAQETPVMILDEPTAFLDLPGRIEIMRLLRQLTVHKNKGILVTTHDLEQALRFADKLWLIAQGKEMACGVPEDLLLNGDIESFFAREGILFDVHTGCFKSDDDYSERVHIIGKGITSYWVRNALERNGFKPDGSHKTGIQIEITQDAEPEFIISGTRDEDVRTHSIESLLHELRSYNLENKTAQ
ncbi:MAG: ABC transporter ATP-binding protein [Bacteroidota bacterium]|nr:ABC transporter ATP-binding protein [Bacteroidota bacterium]